MTKIEWTDETWNPVRGCDKISLGCAHCYAETFAERWRGVAGHPYEYGFDVRLVPEKIAAPLAWKKPRMIFVNSMSDLFHEDVPDAYIDQVFAVMLLCPQHTFQVLTKRSERMHDYCSRPTRRASIAYGCGAVTAKFLEEPLLDPLLAAWNGRPDDWYPLANVWLGVSVEDQKRADARREFLRRTPAAVRFVSYEPALGPVDWTGWEFINQLIMGGESGVSARPCDIAWLRSALAWCRGSGVAPFVKQLGSRCVAQEMELTLRGWLSDLSGGYQLLLKKKKGGDPAEWPADLRVREWPVAVVSS